MKKVCFYKSCASFVANKLALFLPGISGGLHIGRFNFLIENLNKQGIDVLGYEAWTNKGQLEKLSVKDIMEEALVELENIIKEKNYSEIIGIGKSFGGMLTLYYHKDFPFTKLILIAPVFNIDKHSNIDDLYSVKFDQVSSLRDFKITENFLGNIKADTLLIYGDKDSVVNQEYVDIWRKNSNNLTIEVIMGADHSYDSEREQEDLNKTINDYLDKIKDIT